MERAQLSAVKLIFFPFYVIPFCARMDKYSLFKCNTTRLSFILVLVSTVSSMGPMKPMPIEYALSRLTPKQKEEFVDEHNRFRSLVNPPAANMEYMVRIYVLFVTQLYVISYV